MKKPTIRILATYDEAAYRRIATAREEAYGVMLRLRVKVDEARTRLVECEQALNQEKHRDFVTAAQLKGVKLEDLPAYVLATRARDEARREFELANQEFERASSRLNHTAKIHSRVNDFLRETGLDIPDYAKRTLTGGISR